MSRDSELQKHYALLLGVGSPWEVKNVELKLAEKKVEIELGWQWGAAAKCPECGRECSIHDCAPERTWRHLDTMQFTTLVRARTPRSDCPEHGVKTMAVPWAAPQGRFTLLFERFAVEVLLASATISQACELLGSESIDIGLSSPSLSSVTATDSEVRTDRNGFSRLGSGYAPLGILVFVLVFVCPLNLQKTQ